MNTGIAFADRATLATYRMAQLDDVSISVANSWVQ
jgi:hypothetical protein